MFSFHLGIMIIFYVLEILLKIIWDFLFEFTHLTGKKKHNKKHRKLEWVYSEETGLFLSLSFLSINLVKNHLVDLCYFQNIKISYDYISLELKIYGIMPIMWFKVLWETYSRNKYKNYLFVYLVNIYAKATTNHNISWLWDSKDMIPILPALLYYIRWVRIQLSSKLKKIKIISDCS